MILDKVTIICLVSCTAAGLVAGYKAHLVTVVSTVPAVIKTAAEDRTARRIVSTVTKYLPGPVVKVKGECPSAQVASVTKTVIEQPHEVTHEFTDVKSLPTLLPQYSMGVGCNVVACSSVSGLQLSAAMRLGQTNFWAEGTANVTKFTLGVRYEF